MRRKRSKSRSSSRRGDDRRGDDIRAPQDEPGLFINRELSQLRFLERVLSMASDPLVPLLERMRFLSISSSILDEFFEIRVGALKEQVAIGLRSRDPDGLSPLATLQKIRDVAQGLIEEQYRVLNEVLLPALAAEGIAVYRRGEWSPKLKAWARKHFEQHVLPVLTPVGLDPSHPFPRILNKSLNLIVSLDGQDAFGRRSGMAVVQAPRVLPRLIALPPVLADVPFGFVLLSSLIHDHLDELFPGLKVVGCNQFRVTRDSDLWIDEEEVEDVLLAVKGELPRRHFGDAVRLEVSDTTPAETVHYLLERFKLAEADLYRVNGPVNLHRLDALYGLVDRPELKYASFVPGLPAKLDLGPRIFDVLREQDVLLHHPYQSFAPVIELVRQAARDPDVLAIRQTVYRAGSDSPFGNALLEAARNGKEVTAVVELRARFDEAANIDLASRLQEAGAKVVYGVVGYKTHAKMMLIVRREGDELRRYVHLGTGNYNPKTAATYTDFGLLTSDPAVGEDVHQLFQQLTGFGRSGKLNKLIQSPFDLHGRILELIAKEGSAAEAGRPSRIIAKMNSLIEPEVISALYRASQRGVQIDLIVRGLCALRPGVPGVSDNIRVRSVIGRFLEHHRVYYFLAGGDEVTLCSSADWMSRNFFRRIEVAFPIEGKRRRKRVFAEGLEAYLKDDCQAWQMEPDGTYRRLAPGEGQPGQTAQTLLLQALAKIAS